MDSRDRRATLRQSASFNGIDFVEVFTDDEMTLRVHFLNAVALQRTVSAVPTIDGGETIRSVAVNPIDDATDWEAVGNHLVLWLTVVAPGDFSNYTLTLHSARLDPFFAAAVFSFKARCLSDLDCEAPVTRCPPAPVDQPPIDYLAKDFLSFRRALLDFSALRYPEWQERSEADFGVTFLEALSALADDLSYTQDRIATEASLETATQRRSVVRHARLVDYEPQPAIAARAMVQVDVVEGTGPIAAGLVVSAQGPDSTPIVFETGTGLKDATLYPVSAMWNRHQADGRVGITPYYWDDSQRCLAAGATDMWVVGTGFGFFDGQTLLLDTTAESPADPPIRELVRLVVDPQNRSETVDPLFPGSPVDVTHIVWRKEDALRFDHDLTIDAGDNPRTIVVGNLLPATQAVRTIESFAIRTAPETDRTMPLAIGRNGPNDSADVRSLQWLYTLSHAPVAWLQPDAANVLPLPEILMAERGTIPSEAQWGFLRRLLDPTDVDNIFTLDAARFSRVGRNSDGSIQYDYDDDRGDTIRFGDGTFGEIPSDGAVFDVTYRVGGGAVGNVAADAITHLGPDAAKAGIVSVTNPLAAGGGDDAEPLERVRRLAPEQFRAVQYRALRAEDYQAAAQTLPWVQRAGTVFRWTGSWLTVFTTADPLESEQITIGERTELINLLNRYRMAGYESYVPEASYVSLDVAIELCALPDAFRGDVKAAVLAVLRSTAAGGSVGFFAPDRFTFGQPLERSRLEATIQNAPGVSGVTCVRFRIRNRTAGLAEMPDVVAVGSDEIIRCDNDPSFPEHGSLNVTIRGGK